MALGVDGSCHPVPGEGSPVGHVEFREQEARLVGPGHRVAMHAARRQRVGLAGLDPRVAGRGVDADAAELVARCLEVAVQGEGEAGDLTRDAPRPGDLRRGGPGEDSHDKDEERGFHRFGPSGNGSGRMSGACSQPPPRALNRVTWSEARA